eukprot:273656-Prymnesium_polylepis.1
MDPAPMQAKQGGRATKCWTATLSLAEQPSPRALTWVGLAAWEDAPQRPRTAAWPVAGRGGENYVPICPYQARCRCPVSRRRASDEC